jgi:hypothetical protein
MHLSAAKLPATRGPNLATSVQLASRLTLEPLNEAVQPVQALESPKETVLTNVHHDRICLRYTSWRTSP